jgi:Chaperone of endosialidase
MFMETRKKTLPGVTKGTVFATVFTAMVLFFSLPVFAETPLADVTITSNSIGVQANSADTSFMMLRIKGPEGTMVFDQSSNGTPLVWTSSYGISDGLYKWEVKASTATPISDRSKTPPPNIQPWSASGSFSVSNFGIVPAGNEPSGCMEPLFQGVSKAVALLAEFLLPSAHAADLIVDGSACVGEDCVTGESFGFDTLRLKENNLRIGFQDTSATGDFPANDWEITINDSSNGGANYFGVTDTTAARRIFTLEAGAPANSLYVDNGGRLGLGTSNPVVQFHMTDGNTPTVRLEQDGSSGFTPQTWDVAGNEANFFVRDATNGSTLPFRIQPNTPTNTLYLKTGGNIGIGTSSPTATLHIQETDVEGSPGVDDPLTVLKVEAKSNGSDLAEVFTVARTGDTLVLGNLDVGSSRSYKQNIHAVSGLEAMEALEDLSPVHFSYRSSPDVHSIGFIAEDVPDIVATKDRKSLRPMDLVALLTKVTQEQQKTIDSLSVQVAALSMQRQPVSGEKK